MKVTKSTIYRLTAHTKCGCKAVREFEDGDYKKPLAESVFTACEKHNGKDGVDMVEMLLTELIEKEAEEHVAPANPEVPAPRPGASAVVGKDGELVMRVPIAQRQATRTVVRPSGTAATDTTPVANPNPAPPPKGVQVRASGAGAPAAGARTGPRSTYVRPTASARTAAAPGLNTAVAEEGEDDLFAANEVEDNSR